MGRVKRVVSADAELIDELLRRVEALDNVRAGAAVRVSEGTIRRWRNGDRRSLRRNMRDKIHRYFDGVSTNDAASAEGASTALVVLADVRTRIDELEKFWQAQLELARAQTKPMPAHTFRKRRVEP